jgi:hypothetical protein
VAEWRNCVFLWVNVVNEATTAAGFANAFLDGGRKLTWFGGSRMSSSSQVVLRLMELTDPAQRTDAEPFGISPCALMFVRRPGEAYACLGRVLRCLADLEADPIRCVKQRDSLVHILSIALGPASCGSS